MRFVVDENLAVTPRLTSLASHISALPGRQIANGDLMDADALLVRSVTPVNAALLAGTPVKFVGTATAGVEHLAQAELDAVGVPIASAPGSNAQAVVEWVISVIAHQGRLDSLMNGATVGVVGLGQVGTRLSSLLLMLGAQVVAYDPLRLDWPAGVVRAELGEVLEQPIVSLHAALTHTGDHPSYQMVDVGSLPATPVPGQLFLNAGRGGLVTRSALIELADRGAKLALDTWPDEPVIDASLLSRTCIATPHIAGYSAAAKARATDMLLEAMASALGLEIPLLPPIMDGQRPTLQSDATEPAHALVEWLGQHYPLQDDDARLRALCGPESGVQGADFDGLRRDYPLRSEWPESNVFVRATQQQLRPYAAMLGLTVINQEVNEQ